MSRCVVCDFFLPIPAENRGYNADDEPVHLSCDDTAEAPCWSCNLIHKGICT